MMSGMDPGEYDQEELELSMLRGRLDAAFLCARAWCGDVQAMCMYGDWLLRSSLEPGAEERAVDRVREAQHWLHRAASCGSVQGQALLRDASEIEASIRRWSIRAAAQGDELGEELLAQLAPS